MSASPGMRVEFGWAALLLVAMLPGCWDLLDSSDAGTGGSANNGGTNNNCLSTYSPCGGDVTGTWVAQSICPSPGSNPVVGVTANLNFAAYPDCAGACTAAWLAVSGYKTYASGVLTSAESFQLNFTLSLNEACFNERQGTSLTDSTCQAAADANYISCGLSNGTCSCQSDQTIDNTATSYSLAGNLLTEMGADSSLMGPGVAYCVTGNTMTQQRGLPPSLMNYVVAYVRK